MIRSIYIPKDAPPRRDLPNDQIREAIKDPTGKLWVSLENATSVEQNLLLRDTFHFHPLAIEDCQNVGYQTPKVDEFDDQIFVIAQALQPGQSQVADEGLDHGRLSRHPAKNWT